MPSPFVHLHVHSHYSLLDGLGKIPDLVKQAKVMGMDALALTDHGVLYGAIEFYKECKSQGVKPIIGMEAYVALESRFQKRARIDNDYTHLVLIAKDFEGYRNLLKLSTLGHLEGYYYKPRIDWELLERHHAGLIALSGCLRGAPARDIASQQSSQRALATVQAYDRLFGRDNYYLELQHHPSVALQQTVNDALVRISRETGVPLVATADSHYIASEDADAQDVLLCLQTKSRRDDPKRLTFLGEDLSLSSSEAMERNFAHVPEAITNTRAIADRVELEIPLGQVILPAFPLPEGVNSTEELKRLCELGLAFRYGDQPPPAVFERLRYEMEVIATTGFASYFLIVADFVNWAKRQGIMVGPGRGSAAGSLVSYLLNITNVDPIRYQLFFERFLNPERVSMPDIDLDFADHRRAEVIAYVEQKYGKDKVAQIITFGTMAARAAVRDCGRVLGVSYSYCDALAKRIPMGFSLEEALEGSVELQELYAQEKEARMILDAARKVENVARHSSTHACGVVVSDKALVEYVPLQFASSDDQTIVSQYDLHSVEDIGLLKMDFLGLKNLTVLEKAVRVIHATRGVALDINAIPLDDPKTFALLQEGDTTGVFQLESAGMRRYLIELKPTVLEDIIAMVALYRPGPMELIPDFIAGKRGKRAIGYLHPKLEPILRSTYGIAVYQEQVLQIARDIAGFTLGEADVLRKAIGKKIKTLLFQQREKFINGAVGQGVSRTVAEKLFDFTEPFARYGFNRAHATCYGLIAYQTGYLKANFPVEFMAALLDSELGDVERIAVLVGECRQKGIAVLPPDIHESRSGFTVVGGESTAGTIRFGLSAIKNLGEGVVEKIIGIRTSVGRFRSIGHLLKTLGAEVVNKKSLESLIKAGALDPLGDRSQLLGNIERLLKWSRTRSLEAGNAGQSSLLSLVGGVPMDIPVRLDPVAPEPRQTLLNWEKELLGLYVSDHPLTPFEGALGRLSMPFALVKTLRDQQEAVIGGLVRGERFIYTKKGEKMAFVQVESKDDALEVIVFPDVLENSASVWEVGSIVLVRGKVSHRSGATQLVASKAIILTAERIDALLAQTKEKT